MHMIVLAQTVVMYRNLGRRRARDSYLGGTTFARSETWVARCGSSCCYANPYTIHVSPANFAARARKGVHSGARAQHHAR